jgi:glutamate-ammonia-ligase adenylyltransferase
MGCWRTVPSALEQLWHCAPEDRSSAIDRLPAAWRDAGRGLVEGPDPQGALLRGLRLSEHEGALPFSPRVCELLHQGGYPARLFGLHGSSEPLDRPAQSRDDLLASLRAQSAEHGASEGLARVRNAEYLRLASREVTGAPLEEVGGSLSLLAECCVEFALENERVSPGGAPLSESVAVMGMGKLGGCELNFFSDIDLVFVHADDAVGSDPASQQRDRSRIHDALRRVVKALEGSGVWRPLFRVDLRLRPFGSRGPLSMSASATEAYYERHGRAWERQVWLRARTIAGRRDIGEQLAERLVPFVHRRALGPEVFDEVAEMMARARREGRRKLSGESIDVKLDPGGIREVEFFVQALQLLHAGRDASLRSANTLGALDRLAAAGLVSDREHGELESAYRWFRRVEHRVQLSEGQQTHSVPGDSEQRGLLAARLSAGGSDPDDFPGDVIGLDQKLSQHRERVRAIAGTLTGAAEGQPELLESERRRLWAHSVVEDPGASEANRQRALQELGMRDPTEASALLQHLFGRRQGAFSSGAAARLGANRLLLACLDSADPDAALQRLAQFSAARPAHYSAWRFLAAPGRDETLRQIADLFGASEPLSRGLIGFPNQRGVADDGCITLLRESAITQLPDRDTLRNRWTEGRAYEAGEKPPTRVARSSSAHPSESHPPSRGAEALDMQLLRFKHRELVRIGLFDLGRRPDPLAVGESLSSLADVIVGEVLEDIARDPGSPISAAPPFTLATFALGKFGMGAMDYGSDLDLVFVFEVEKGNSAPEAQYAAQKAARRLLARLQDAKHGTRLYEVDMRLRPSGRQGLLVSSLGGFKSYHDKPLPVWERLALLRLRPIAAAHFGIPAEGRERVQPVGTDLIRQVTEVIVPNSVFPDSPGAYAEVSDRVRALKQRIEREIARETRDVHDVKSGVGGCLELELLASALQLRAGREHASLRRRLTVPQTLEALGAIGKLHDSEVRALAGAYRFLRRLLNRLRMSRGAGAGGGADRLAVNSPRLGPIARRMGLIDQRSLVSTYLVQRDLVRAAFNRHLD